MGRSIPEATIAVGRVRSMPFGRARAEAAARQVRLIEAEGPDEVRAYALESLVEALTWIGEPSQAVVPFIKLLRWWDAHPELFDTGDQNILFWEFGWIVADMCRNPSISVDRVERTLDDMERRFALANRGGERVWSCRLDWELLRHGPNLESVFTTWLTKPIDGEDSCPACHQEHHADYLVEIGDLEGAAAILEAALSADLNCSREPASILALLAWCYLELGRLDDVERILPQAASEIRTCTSMSVLVAYCRLFEVYARGVQLDRAIALLPKIIEGVAAATPYVRLEAWRHVLAARNSLMSEFDRELQLPDLMLDSVEAVMKKVGKEALELTEAFDNRHGNQVQANRLLKVLQKGFVARPLVLAEVSAPPAKLTNNRVAVAAPPAPEDELVELAEESFRAGRHASAARLYAQAADQAQAAGRLTQAGWCWAEAARNWQEVKQVDEATRHYVKAQARLKAAQVSLEEIAPLFVTWAPAVRKEDYSLFLDLARQDYPTPAQTGPRPLEEVLPVALQAGMPVSTLLRRYMLARADLNDAVARVMARFGRVADRRTALTLAEQSASRYSSLGRTDDAAHAWWLAGKVAARLDDESADASFTMAMQSFRSTGQRNRRFGQQVARDYAKYLITHGRTEQALELLSP